MSLKIAIQSDEVVHRNGERQSFSERWSNLAFERGHTPVAVDVFADDIVEQVSCCDAFMWRCEPSAHPRVYAKKLLPAIEQGLRIPVFPSWKASWHFEDKVAQHYLLSAAGIPTPRTHVFWTRTDAERFCDRAAYPLVLKLASGYQATNVRLIRSRAEARFYIARLFGPGTVGLGYRPASTLRSYLRRVRNAAQIARGQHPGSPSAEAELQHGYLYLQEFLPDNAFDTRVTVIGNRAFAFRRLNRDDDFRASGSGRIDWEPEAIDEDAIRLGFKVAAALECEMVAVDVLQKRETPVVIELTLSYASWAVRECPGHWVLKGEPMSGMLDWQAGSVRPEDIIFDDFVQYINQVS